MRRLCVFLTALLLPLFAFEMNADEEKTVVKIPLKVQSGTKLNRGLTSEPVESFYNGISSEIVTFFSSDLGNISLTVTNYSTGEVWYDFFDSAAEPQTYLPVSGTDGMYEVVYITESGDVYEGSFTIE